MATYTAVLGAGASRTPLAGQRLAALARPTAEAPKDRPVAALMGPTLDAQQASNQPPNPSAGAVIEAPDAGSQPDADALVQADPELAQLEDDIARLRSQAASVSPDPADFRRRTAERARRDAQCNDKACLLLWYARRRSELLAEF